MATKTYININGQNIEGSVDTPDRKFRDAWEWDGKVVTVDKTKKAEIMSGLIKNECGDRINDVAPDYTQRNMVVSAMLNDSDKALLGKWNSWVNDMKATCNSLASAEDMDYSNDDKWPKVDADLQAFIDAN